MDRPSPPQRQPEVDLSLLQRPFLAAVLLSLFAGGAVLLAGRPELHSAGRLATLGLLAAGFATLQWNLPRVPPRRAPFLGYVGALGALALALGLAVGSWMATLVLSLATLGLAVGALRRRGDVAAVAVGLTALVVGLGLFLDGRSALLRLASTALPTMLFVTFYVEMYQRQARARAQSQRALAELDEAHRQLAASAAQVETLTVAAERQRMARELHDTLAQTLAGLSLQLEALDAYLAKGDTTKAQAILTQARERAKAALSEARSAIDDLRTSGTPGDFSAAVREQARRFEAATGIACQPQLPASLALPAPLAAHALRFVGEGLSNCARHAGARRVSLAVRADSEALSIELEDDGRGFDAAAEPQAGHYGLLGLRERARLAGGSLEIDSAPGRGARLRFTAPLREVAS